MLQYFKYIGLLTISLFFLFFGVDLLIASYRLTNPFAFVMTFFASNLMILISAALALGFALRIRGRYRTAKQPKIASSNLPQ